MATITQTTTMQSSGRERPKPPPPPIPSIKPPPPPPPPVKSETAAIIKQGASEHIGVKRTQHNEHPESEGRKILKSHPTLTALDSSNSLWVPKNLRDLNVYQQQRQVGQGTYG